MLFTGKGIKFMKKLIPLLFVLVLVGCSANSAGEYSETRIMMDTVCTIRAGGDAAQAAVSAAFDRISQIEDLTSLYSEFSEVASINRAAADEKIPLSDDMTEILTTALDVCEKSNGAFDITVAPLKDIWSFSEGAMPPTDTEIKNALKHVGYEQLTLDTEGKTLVKSGSECKIDLGGAAKGYAADCAAEVLKEYGCDYAVTDLGGNIYVFGKNPARADGSWLIGIQNPYAANGEYSQTVTLTDGAVVTAGSYRRYFEWQGKKYHHILNPETGYPSDSGISGASIKADSALLADCLSTACMVLGEAAGESLAKEFNTELIACD